MSAAFFALTHPAVPLAWWAANSPPVVELLGRAVGEGSRRLADAVNFYGEADKDPDALPAWVYPAIIAGALVPICIWLVIAAMYKSKVTDERGEFIQPQPQEEFSLAGGRNFKYGTFACCDDMQYFFHGCCAPTVRVADTFQATGAASYWTVVGAFLLTWILAQVIGFGVTIGLRELMGILVADMEIARLQRMNNNAGQIGWFIADSVLALWLAGLRKQLRSRLGDPAPGSHFFQDCVCYWWCNCCTAVQDARQVDGSQSVRVECCCKFMNFKPAPAPAVGVAVGAPVIVGTPVIG